ncbi:formimidoylglutamase [Haloarcula nitratireducens]|uniref:Formimidoylglutamase n=1 Tax=Haloarcula nitratireducens TaxID=2487749 RepID=A0AAW4P645_9EURY|nr:formimidoylglutamase [Halomicroarcula nitratireducens]MBX0293327.1 formimidoylglutamase [Halomicroarcula nitratireducens]
MSELTTPPEWGGPSDDPNDEQFGDVIEGATLDSAGDYDAVLVGEPYDGAVIGRKGAREGPEAIRRELAGTKTHHVDRGPVDSVGDLGDVAIPDDCVEGVQFAVQETAAAIYDAGAFPVFLGGDNSLTFPNAAPLLTDGTLGALSFDAHLDCREVRGDPTSGTPYRQLHEAGLDAFAVVGARHFETSTAYHEYVAEQGGHVTTPEAVEADPKAAVDEALGSMDGVDSIYVSLDLDVLDSAVAPGVSAPTPGGLTARELFAMLGRVAAHDRVVGFEVVECAPPLDDGFRTARVAARAVAHFLSGLGVAR